MQEGQKKEVSCLVTKWSNLRKVAIQFIIVESRPATEGNDSEMVKISYFDLHLSCLKSYGNFSFELPD